MKKGKIEFGNKKGKDKAAVRKRRTLRLAFIAVFVALIAVGAFIKVPIGIVPGALQCGMCILCALILGWKDGLVAVAIYTAMGLVGIPIFTKGGGFSYVLQPTFGYIAAYLIAVPVGGLIARGVRGTSRPKLWRLLLGAFASLVIVYTIGVNYMFFILRVYMGKAMLLSKAWMTGCAVFLPTDSLWCVLGALVAYKVVPIIFKSTQGVCAMSADAVQEEYSRSNEGNGCVSVQDKCVEANGVGIMDKSSKGEAEAERA